MEGLHDEAFIRVPPSQCPHRILAEFQFPLVLLFFHIALIFGFQSIRVSVTSYFFHQAHCDEVRVTVTNSKNQILYIDVYSNKGFNFTTNTLHIQQQASFWNDIIKVLNDWPRETMKEWQISNKIFTSFQLSFLRNTPNL